MSQGRRLSPRRKRGGWSKASARTSPVNQDGGCFLLALALQYALFVFWAAMGTIQLAAVYAGLSGLQLVRSRRSATLIGGVLLAISFLWFFGPVDRNVRGLEGAEQTLLFIPAAIAAVATTVVATSLIHRFLQSRGSSSGARRRERGFGIARGLEALRSMNYIEAVFGEDEGPRA